MLLLLRPSFFCCIVFCKALSFMAFVRKKVKTFKWPVKVEEPADGGVFSTASFTAIFKRVPRSLFENVEADSELSLLKEIVVGWEGIEDEDGSPVAFSKKALEEFSDDPYWIRGVLRSYTETFEGAKAGN